jgi:[ribosomal protein S18]-alanine N-acetyltransferase
MTEVSPFVLRPMTVADIEEIVPLEAELFADDPPWSAEQFASELAGVPDSRWYVVAVHDGGAIAGYAGLMAGIDSADIQTVAVAPAFHRQGLGTVLVDALLEEARRRRVADVLLEVRADNDAAIQLYRAHGFEQIARRRGYYGTGRVDGLVLRRRLSSE